MRKLLLYITVVFVAAISVAAPSSSDAIITVLNSKTAGSDKHYNEALSVLASDAKSGKIVQQFLMALISREGNLPSNLSISEKLCNEYMEKSRPKIHEMARKRNNSLAWFLIFLETNEPAILEHAANLGNVQALNAYGMLKMSKAMEVLVSSPEEANVMMKECFESFARAADMGDANALNSLGICYQNGYGTLKDDNAAFKSFSKAAEQAHPEAINNMGRFYREGVVVKKDLNQAFKCFERSSSLGNVWGTINKASALFIGEGCAPDSKKALSILNQAAKSGSADAMDFLSSCYQRGIGDVKPDSYLSMVWKIRAKASRGDKNALQWLRDSKAEL